MNGRDGRVRDYEWSVFFVPELQKFLGKYYGYISKWLDGRRTLRQEYSRKKQDDIFNSLVSM